MFIFPKHNPLNLLIEYVMNDFIDSPSEDSFQKGLRICYFSIIQFCFFLYLKWPMTPTNLVQYKNNVDVVSHSLCVTHPC